jgi:hypothetical protein
MIGDGQVTMGAEVVKPNVKKVRRIGTGVIGGFAGARPVRCCAATRARRRHDATRAAAPLARAALPAPAAALLRRHSARACPRCRAQLRQRVPSTSRRSAPAYACAPSNPGLARALTRALRAGATADAFTLFERLENKLEEHPARALPLLPCCRVCLAHRVRTEADASLSLVRTRAPRSAGAADARVRGAGQGVAHGQVPAPLGRAQPPTPLCSLRILCACD